MKNATHRSAWRCRLPALALLAALLLLCPAALGDQGDALEQDFEVTVLDDGSASIARYIGEKTEVFIPRQIDGMLVTEIGESAFEGLSGITRIVLPQRIRAIGSRAFWGCTALESFHLTPEVETIGMDFLYGCDALTEIAIPGSVKTVQGWTLSGMNGLERIVFEEGVETIEQFAIDSCPAVREVVLPRSLRAMDIQQYDPEGEENVTYTVTQGTYAHWWARLNGALPWSTPRAFAQIEHGALPSEADASGGLVLKPGKTLTGDVTLPQTPEGDYRAVGAWAFYNSDKLTGVAIPEGYTALDSHAFYDCGALSAVLLPDTLERIDSFAFSDCGALTTILIPESVTQIGRDAFYDCDSLRSVIGEPGSCAQELAEELGIAFVDIGYFDDPIETPPY